jgi:hypothetical protein
MKQHRLSSAALLLVAGFFVVVTAPAFAQVPSSRLTSQAASATPQEPTTLCELFRIDQATGAPVALERAKVKVHAVPLGPSMRKDEWYGEYHIWISGTRYFELGTPRVDREFGIVAR